jgi:hypothetical protein
MASPQSRSLAARLADVPKGISTKERLADIDSIYADVDSIPNLSSSLKKKLLANLDDLTDAVRAGQHSDAEILIDTLISDLTR